MNSTQDLLRQFGDCLESLGLQLSEELEAAEAFASGPPVVWVVGRPKSGKSSVVDALQASSRHVIEFAVDDAEPTGLYDVLIICTPADAALSARDVALATAAAELKRPTHVVVTGIDRFGIDRRTAVIEELERFRLQPLLGGSAVGWSFIVDAANEAPALSKVVDAADSESLHELPLLQWMLAKSRWGKGQYDSRVIAKEQDRERVADLEEDVPALEARMHDISESARMRFRESCRAAWEQLHETISGAGRAFVAGLAADEDAAKDQSVRLVREAYEAFQQEIQGTWSLVELRRRADLDELLARPAIVAADTQVPEPVLGAQEVPEPELVQRLVGDLTNVDVPTLFSKVCQTTIDSLPDDPEDNDDVVRRAGAGVRRWVTDQIAPTLQERVQTELAEVIDSLLQPRYETLLNKGADAVKDRFRDQHDGLVTSLRDAVVGLRSQVDSKHDWQGSLARLLQLEDSVLELIREHGR